VASLEAQGFTVTVKEDYSASAANTVISQNPAAGSLKEKGGAVTIVVSRGSPAVFSGMISYWDTSAASKDYFTLNINCSWEQGAPVKSVGIECFDGSGNIVFSIGSVGGFSAQNSRVINEAYYSISEGGASGGSLIPGKQYSWKAYAELKDGRRFESSAQTFVFSTGGARYK